MEKAPKRKNKVDIEESSPIVSHEPKAIFKGALIKREKS